LALRKLQRLTAEKTDDIKKERPRRKGNFPVQKMHGGGDRRTGRGGSILGEKIDRREVLKGRRISLSRSLLGRRFMARPILEKANHQSEEEGGEGS